MKRYEVLFSKINSEKYETAIVEAGSSAKAVQTFLETFDSKGSGSLQILRVQGILFDFDIEYIDVFRHEADCHVTYRGYTVDEVRKKFLDYTRMCKIVSIKNIGRV